MYCLRSYIPLLLLPVPLSMSPIHIAILLSLTYLLNRPCIYCSVLLLVLLISSCQWSGRCLIDFSYKTLEEGGAGIATWWLPRLYTTCFNDSTAFNASSSQFLSDLGNQTISNIAHLLSGEFKGLISGTDAVKAIPNNTSLLGRLWYTREWTLPCIGTKVVF